MVAFEIDSRLFEEMERLNQSFGIGIIELKSNPFESKVLFTAKYKDIDFKTIDKLCNVNKDFAKFIDQVKKVLSSPEDYINAIKIELNKFCDEYFLGDNESEIEEYCKKKHIPVEEILSFSDE